MGRKEFRKRKRLQAKTHPGGLDHTRVGVPTPPDASATFPGEEVLVVEPSPGDQPKTSGEAKEEAETLKEQYYPNDSLGG